MQFMVTTSTVIYDLLFFSVDFAFSFLDFLFCFGDWTLVVFDTFPEVIVSVLVDTVALSPVVTVSLTEPLVSLNVVLSLGESVVTSS